MLDGDTVVVAGIHVRLKGVAAPEVAHAGEAGEPGGDAARAFMTVLIEGQTIGVRADPGVHRWRRELGGVDIRLHEKDSARAGNRIQGWKTETRLGSKCFERRAMGAGCAAASWQARRSWSLGRRQPAVFRGDTLGCAYGVAMA